MAQALADQPTEILSTQSTHALSAPNPMDTELNNTIIHEKLDHSADNRRRSKRIIQPARASDAEIVACRGGSPEEEQESYPMSSAEIEASNLPTPPPTNSSTPRQHCSLAAANLSIESSNTISSTRISKRSSEMLGNASLGFSQNDGISHIQSSGDSIQGTSQDYTNDGSPASISLSSSLIIDDPMMTGCIDPNLTKKRAHAVFTLATSSIPDTQSSEESVKITTMAPEPQHSIPMHTENVAKKKKSGGSRHFDRQCTHCGTCETPMWRRGPLGTGTLCNKCGVKWRNGRLPASAVKDMIMNAPPRPPLPPPSTRSSTSRPAYRPSYDSLRDSPLSTKDIMKASTRVSKSRRKSKKSGGILTYSEKQKLTSIINDLPIDKLGGIVEIIGNGGTAAAESANQDGELEVDLDAVPNHVLLELTRYVEKIRGSRRVLQSSSDDQTSEDDSEESDSDVITDTSDEDYM